MHSRQPASVTADAQERSLVSVIMPVYNGEPFIAQAIGSVLAQTCQDWELVVIDDGSTDHTARTVLGYRDPRIRYTYQENRGQTAALNRGLELARGEYVTTLDADDWLAPNSLSDRCAYLDSHRECGAVYSDGYYCDASGGPLLRFGENRAANPVGDVYGVLIASPFYAAGSSVIIRRDLIDQHRLRYDESIVWCQDWDFYIRVSEYALFGYVDSPTVYYRLHDTNMTRTMDKGRRWQSLIHTSRKVMASARFAAVPDGQKEAFFYRFLVDDLRDSTGEQDDVVNGAPFRSLPPRAQARLLRWLATSYLLRAKQRVFVSKWSRSAWLMTPLDPRASLIAVLSATSFDLAVLAARSWRRRHQATSLSPFDLAKGAGLGQADGS